MRHSQILTLVLVFAFLIFGWGCAYEKPMTQSSDSGAPASETKVSSIQKISYAEAENYTRIQIEGSETISPPFYKLLSDPLRIVIDLPAVDLKQVNSPVKIENGTVGDVLATQSDDKGRIEISLLQMTNYNISQEGNNLIIDVEKVKKAVEEKASQEAALGEKSTETPAAEIPKVEEGVKEEAVKEAKTALPAEEPNKEESSPVLIKAKEVLNIQFENKKEFVVFNILADGKIENFNAFKLDGPPRLVIDIWGVNTHKTAFKVPSPFVKKVRVGHYPDKLRLVFDSNKPKLSPYQVNRIDNKLIVSLGNIPLPSEPQIFIEGKKGVKKTSPKPGEEKVNKTEAKSESVTAAPKETGAALETEKGKEDKPVPELTEEEEKPEIKPAPPAPIVKKPEPKKVTEIDLNEKAYTGRKLSLDFKDADIKNILRLIAEVSNLNIIAGDDVTGKVSMRLVDVPWDQALDLILKSKNLGMVKSGNVVRVAPNDTLKREVQAELEARRAKDRLEDLLMELIPVNYATAKDIMPQVKNILSDRGDVKVDDRTNILVVKDIAKNIIAVKNLVRALDTKTPQVLIEARIVEANLTFQKELGVRWGFLYNNGSKKAGGGASTGTGGPNGTSILDSVTNTNNVIDLPAIPQVGTAGVIEFLYSKGTINELDLQISAHENNGDVKIISSPKIATLDNKEASIEQGLRIPFLKLSSDGTTSSVDFIEANLKLVVTPHVTNDGYIKMNIRAKKDAPDNSIIVQQTPSIDKKEAITEVLVKDGGVVTIAGVYSISKTNSDEGVPLFKQIPLLGWLFKRKAQEDIRKDLLIFISPRILKDI